MVNQELAAAVEALYPGAQIIDAEIEDKQIEVEVIITINNKKNEIELLFTMAYVLIESEIEYKTTYENLPNEFKKIKEWFTNNVATHPTPLPATLVEITEGDFTEEGSKEKYKYEVEIEYEIERKEYEVEFYLDAEYAIIKVKLDD